MKPVHITPDHPWYAEAQRVVDLAKETRERMDLARLSPVMWGFGFTDKDYSGQTSSGKTNNYKGE